MSEHESQGQSFIQPINTPCRYLYVSSSTSAWNAEIKDTLPLFLKHICCVKSVGSLRSESCRDPRNQDGQDQGKHQQHTCRAEVQGKPMLSLCHTTEGIGWGYRAAGLLPIHLITTGPKGKHVLQGAGTLLTMVCQGILIFGLLHHFFSSPAHLE